MTVTLRIFRYSIYLTAREWSWLGYLAAAAIMIRLAQQNKWHDPIML